MVLLERDRLVCGVALPLLSGAEGAWLSTPLDSGRSLWVVGVAMIMAAAAIMLASSLHTLHHPNGLLPVGHDLRRICRLVVSAAVPDAGIFFAAPGPRVLPNQTWAVITAAAIFASAHLPNPILTPITLHLGLGRLLRLPAIPQYLSRLAMAHAIFGICVAITIPGPVVHNMRVGLGYLRYRAPLRVHLNQSDHKVSTVAWVMADAPTRRSARHALP